MANGDPVRAGKKVSSEAATEVAASSDFKDVVVFKASPGARDKRSQPKADGIHGLGHRSGSGVVGLGGLVQGAGVVGVGSWGDTAQETTPESGDGGGAGLVGIGGDGPAPTASAPAVNPGFGVIGIGGRTFGHSQVGVQGAGVLGMSTTSDGVVGVTDAADSKSGVLGLCSATGGEGFGVFGRSLAASGAGVAGESMVNAGVWGRSRRIGVLGEALADSDGAVGVMGRAPATGFAGAFYGEVAIMDADLLVHGTLSRVFTEKVSTIKRRLQPIDSPGCWSEDFGEGKLTNGVAVVPIEPGFAKCIDTRDYQVFLTAYGDCRGLFVSARNATSFEVRESAGGRSGVRFGYRLVGRQTGATLPRFGKIRLPPQRLAIQPWGKLSKAALGVYGKVASALVKRVLGTGRARAKQEAKPGRG